MIIHKAPNSNALNITITTESKDFFSLINEAAGTDLDRAGYDTGVNGVDLVVENGDIRYTFQDGLTPTSELGQLTVAGTILHLRHKNLQKLKLVAVSSDVKVGVTAGVSKEGESDSVSTGNLSSNADVISNTATYESVSMSSADTEYTYTLPSAAKSLEMRLDIDSNADFKLNIGGSEGASATDYIPVEDGEMYWRQNLNLAAGTVLRFQSPSASQTMRIVTFN